MLKHIKTLLKDKIIIIAVLITFGILCLSLLKIPDNSAIKIAYIDKIYHCFAYFTLAITWLLTFYKKPEKKYVILISCIVFGIVIEVLQQILTNYRIGDFLDVLANSLGVILALIIFNIILRKKI